MNSEEVRLICFANLHFYIVAFLYYEPKQNPLSQEGGFLGSSTDILPLGFDVKKCLSAFGGAEKSTVLRFALIGVFLDEKLKVIVSVDPLRASRCPHIVEQVEEDLSVLRHTEFLGVVPVNFGLSKADQRCVDRR